MQRSQSDSSTPAVTGCVNMAISPDDESTLGLEIALMMNTKEISKSNQCVKLIMLVDCCGPKVSDALLIDTLTSINDSLSSLRLKHPYKGISVTLILILQDRALPIIVKNGPIITERILGILKSRDKCQESDLSKGLVFLNNMLKQNHRENLVIFHFSITTQFQSLPGFIRSYIYQTTLQQEHITSTNTISLCHCKNSSSSSSSSMLSPHFTSWGLIPGEELILPKLKSDLSSFICDRTDAFLETKSQTLFLKLSAKFHMNIPLYSQTSFVEGKSNSQSSIFGMSELIQQWTSLKHLNF